MYTVMRKYELTSGTKEKIIQDVQERLVPLLIRVPGLRDYALVEVGDNEVIITSTFNTLADAKASARLTKDWLVEHTEFFQEVATLGAGEVRVSSQSECLPLTNEEELLRGVF
jgi:hypothetical protein